VLRGTSSLGDTSPDTPVLWRLLGEPRRDSSSPHSFTHPRTTRNVHPRSSAHNTQRAPSHYLARRCCKAPTANAAFVCLSLCLCLCLYTACHLHPRTHYCARSRNTLLPGAAQHMSLSLSPSLSLLSLSLSLSLSDSIYPFLSQSLCLCLCPSRIPLGQSPLTASSPTPPTPSTYTRFRAVMSSRTIRDMEIKTAAGSQRSPSGGARRRGRRTEQGS